MIRKSPPDQLIGKIFQSFDEFQILLFFGKFCHFSGFYNDLFDRFVYVWDVNSRSLQYKLPGHMGSVNDVQFYPAAEEPIGNFL